MASINISPTSASFGSSGGNGSVSLSVQTDSWHSEPQTGDIWMAQRKRRADGTWNVNDWVVFRIVGEKGEDGSGAAPVYQGEYSSSKSYYGNSTRRDIVKHNNQYWIAKQDAPTSPFSDEEPGTSSGYYYWQSFGASFESVATDLLFSKLTAIEMAYIRQLLTSNTGKRIQIQNNVLTMYDSSDKQKLLVTGEDLGALSDSVSSKSFSSGTMTGTSYEINDTDTLLSTSNFNITSIDNTVELPSITVDVYKSAYSDIINASASLLIDDVVVASSPTFNGEPAGRHIYLTIPATSLSLSKGTHTLKIQAQASSINGTLSTISYPGSSLAGTVDISYNAEKVQIGANGFRAAFGASNYAEFIDDGEIKFVFRAGNYGFKVSSSGIQKSSNMNDSTPTWNSL